MKVVLSATLFAFCLTGGYLLVTRSPWIMVYRDCYQIAYSILNEEHLITRSSWMTDEQVCLDHKNTLLRSLGCFQSAETKQPLGKLEKDLIYTAAQDLAKGTQDINQLIADHNKRCTYRKATLEFDPRTGTWF